MRYFNGEKKMGKWDWLGWLGLGVGVGAVCVHIANTLKEHDYSSFMGKITPHDPIVRNKAIEVIKHPGSYSIEQVLDIFDYMRTLKYVSDPLPNHVALPRDTLKAGGGDCDDFAVSTSSLIKAIGGDARVVVLTGQEVGHALCEVYIGQPGSIMSIFREPVMRRYGNISIAWEIERDKEWLLFDTLLPFPGMLPNNFVEIENRGWNWLPNVIVKYVY